MYVDWGRVLQIQRNDVIIVKRSGYCEKPEHHSLSLASELVPIQFRNP